jgi:hypothetical protein
MSDNGKQLAYGNMTANVKPIAGGSPVMLTIIGITSTLLQLINAAFGLLKRTA